VVFPKPRRRTINITINSDGTVTANAGCNDYQGTWTVTGLYDEHTTAFFDPNDGQAIVFEDLAWGDKVCEDEDVMILERKILDILENTARWVQIEGNLSLRDSEGKFLLEAAAAWPESANLRHEDSDSRCGRGAHMLAGGGEHIDSLMLSSCRRVDRTGVSHALSRTGSY
jgi:heat shock protein HslJ